MRPRMKQVKVKRKGILGSGINKPGPVQSFISIKVLDVIQFIFRDAIYYLNKFL